MAEPSKNPDLLTVVEWVYHQPADQEIVSVPSSFSRPLKTAEQMYQRRLKVSEEAKPLDYGWIAEAGMLIISNEEGKIPRVNLTEEEKQVLVDRVIEVFYADENHAWLVHPGESMRAVPSDVKQLRIRCRRGTALAILSLIPS